jgi:hypothetical protein
MILMSVCPTQEMSCKISLQFFLWEPSMLRTGVIAVLNLADSYSSFFISTWHLMNGVSCFSCELLGAAYMKPISFTHGYMVCHTEPNIPTQ